MENKTLTAVEWLLEQIESKNGKEFSSYYTEFIEQAKAMEKQQITKAFHDGMVTNSQPHIGKAEQYYHQTFKK